MQQISEQLRVLHESHFCRIIMLGDFNCDQRLEENVKRFEEIKQTYNMEQKIQFATHVHGGILDLLFDTNLASNNLEYLPIAYTDHFAIFYGI